MLERFIKPVHAHCDLMCGVYDPAQARIEAESVLQASKKYADSRDEVFKARALAIKEARSEQVKNHLWVLWTDYFKPEHLELLPDLHTTFWQATKAAGEAKKSMDVSVAKELIDHVDRVGFMFEKTKSDYNYQSVIDNLASK